MMLKSKPTMVSSVHLLRSLCLCGCCIAHSFNHRDTENAEVAQRRLPLLLILLVLLISVGCRRDMQDQPKVKPLRGTTFFSDGLGSRQPIEGTVARGFLRSDTEFYTGKKTKAPGATA